MVFSRSTFLSLLEDGDYRRLTGVREAYDPKRRKEKTYLAYLKYLYKNLEQGYRCEYVYKTEVLKTVLADLKQSPDLNVFSEFRLGRTIADIVVFNGHSRVYEIKTEYDSPTRLESQLKEYMRLFQETYVVIPQNEVERYEQVMPKEVGIITLSAAIDGSLELTTYREAHRLNNISAELLMKVLHTREYKAIIAEHFGALPEVSAFEMYHACAEKMQEIPKLQLQNHFISSMKKRAVVSHSLAHLPDELKQIALQLRLSEVRAKELLAKLKKLI